ncbi:mitochondrial transcription rescue factor 1-like [Clytia hemisphaerica]|uniref:mitochondrial transcription rescue factor 1-like n=1 Tax=Clytia hemisphaerica TaxID=252671 RepID=UPI0034D78A91
MSQHLRKLYISSTLYRSILKQSFCSLTTASGGGGDGGEGGHIVDLVVSSLRIDRIIATTLGTGRRKVEYNLLKGLVKLNGQTVTKKSVEVSEGDIIDQFSLENTTDSVYNLNRIQLLEIAENTTKKGNLRVKLYKKKNLSIDKEDYRFEFNTEADT